MKIRCDVCDGAEASVFCAADEAALCAADEAALCGGCDRRVHRANKLAEKHLRFSLLHPTSSSAAAPRCDICQERRAFLFCREDRAILCRECDAAIHGANELTRKHDRFLLTGVKLSADCSFFPTTSYSSSGHVTGNSDSLCSVSDHMVQNQMSDTGSVSTSSISEYLGALPGWCVEDFLDPCSAGSNRLY